MTRSGGQPSLFTKRAVLAAQAGRFLAPRARDAILAGTLVKVSLADPIRDRLGGRLEPYRQRLGTLAGPDELDQTTAELIRIRYG